MSTINQVVRYEVKGKIYKTYAEAEAAIVDELGEEIDGILKNTCLGDNMHYVQHSKVLIQIVENIWANKEKLAPLLSFCYNPIEEGEI